MMAILHHGQSKSVANSPSSTTINSIRPRIIKHIGRRRGPSASSMTVAIACLAMFATLTHDFVAAVPTYVTLPTDLVGVDGKISLGSISDVEAVLRRLKATGVKGVAVEMWWGLIERDNPMMYEWDSYQDVVTAAAEAGLKVKALINFHACSRAPPSAGACDIPLPGWVVSAAKAANAWFKDGEGGLSEGYLTFGADEIEVLQGRSPIAAYSDLLTSFFRSFQDDLGATLVEIRVGLGPEGELRYPSFPNDGRWAMPGIGEFQCFDPFLAASLEANATNRGHPEYVKVPQGVGTYNDRPESTEFFDDKQRHDAGSWQTRHGAIFLDWYAGQLVDHADRVLGAARQALVTNQAPRGEDTEEVLITGSLGTIHWWRRLASQPAEATAGYFAGVGRDAYAGLATAFARHGAGIELSGVELEGDEGVDFMSDPEGLINHTFTVARAAGVRFTVCNAGRALDAAGYHNVIKGVQVGRDVVAGYTFRWWRSDLVEGEAWRAFETFLGAVNSVTTAGLRWRLNDEKALPSRLGHHRAILNPAYNP